MAGKRANPQLYVNGTGNFWLRLQGSSHSPVLSNILFDDRDEETDMPILFKDPDLKGVAHLVDNEIVFEKHFLWVG